MLRPLAVAVPLNASGAFALGLMRGRAARAAAQGRHWDPRILPTLGTGFLGSFTSFSVLTAPLGAQQGRLASTDASEAGAVMTPVGMAAALTAVYHADVVLSGLLIGLAAACGAGLRFLAERHWVPRGLLGANTAASALAGLTVAFGPGLALIGAFTLALDTYATAAVDAAEDLLDGHASAAAGRWIAHLICGAGAATVAALIAVTVRTL